MALTAPKTNKLPGFGLPIDYQPEYMLPNGLYQHKILTVRERTMEQFMNQITDKQDWQIKIHDQNIIDKYYQELLAANIDMTDKMFENCIAELKLEKAQELKSSGIVRVFDLGVFKSDSVVDEQLRKQLKERVFPLENTPTKDWHPGSNETVLDLVHPALYPLVYGRSKILQQGKTNLSDCVRRCGEGVTVPKTEKKESNCSDPACQWRRRRPQLSYSYKYQWLPSEIKLESGKAKITSYINNLHPQKHSVLYTTIEQIIDRVIPMWDRCLSMHTAIDMSKRRIDDIKFEYEYKRIKNSAGILQGNNYKQNGDSKIHDSNVYSNNSVLDKKNSIDYTQALEFPEYHNQFYNSNSTKLSNDNKGSDNKEESDDEIDEKNTEWFKAESLKDQEIMYWYDDSDNDYQSQIQEKYGKVIDRRTIQPEPGNCSTLAERHSAEKERIIKLWQPYTKGRVTKETNCNQPYSFVNLKKAKGLQIIIKLANIELTPEKPKYNGGSWHIEGQLNEHICASAIYYYDQENIGESSLAFRGVVNPAQMEYDYLQGQNAAPEEIYGFENERSAVLPFGDVITKQGRIVAFPNTMQHQVQPFSLQDPTQPGHRKILALFLIDPYIKIISTAHIACQQAEWWQDYIKLPEDSQNEIVKKIEPMTKDEADKIREDLIEERKSFVLQDGKTVNKVKFSLCEH